MTDRTQEEGIALLVSINELRNIGKFSAKLSFEQRCEILALHRLSCTRELLAKLYMVDRRTVTHIYNSQSPHYKNVREEELRLGRDNFIAKYATIDVTTKAFNMATDSPNKGNNKQANRKQGTHNMQNEMCDKPHRVMIRWVTPEEGKVEVAGWYYKDLDSEWPEDWFHGDVESLRTSQECYAHALKDISDPL